MATPPTPQQLQLLKIIPRVTGSLSIIGSTYIIWDVLRSRRKRNGTSPTALSRRPFQVSEGFLLGMSFCDILASVSTPLVGNEAVPPPFGNGNQATCNAQGFFSQFVTATALYTGCLALTYLLSIRYGYKEAQLRSCLEPFLHLLVLLFVLISGTISIYLELYNPTPFSCTMVSVPPLCGGASEDAMPCLRGDNINDWRLLFRTIPEYVVVAFSTIAMLMIYRAVRDLERKSMRWTFRSLSQSHFGLPPNNKSSSISQPEQAQAEQQQIANEMDAPQLDEEEEDVAPFSPLDEEAAIPTQEVNEETTHKKEVSFPMNTTTDNNDADVVADDGVASSTSFQDASGASGETGTTVSFNGTPSSTTPATIATDDPPKSDSSPPTSRRSFLQRSISSSRGRQQQRQSSQSRLRQRRQLLLSRDVGIQGICFILAFLLTWTVPTIARCLMRFGGRNVGIEWVIAINFFLPLQGFWNVLVYIRPKLWNTGAGASSGAGGGSSSFRGSKDSG